jgi:hypothetical protein
VIIDIDDLENITCTFTNTKQTNLTLNKVVVNDNGGTAAESLWNLTATGTVASPTNLSGPGAAGSADVTGVVKPDTYALAETGAVPGYTKRFDLQLRQETVELRSIPTQSFLRQAIRPFVQ